MAFNLYGGGHRHGHSYQADNGMFLMLIGAACGSPFLFWYGFFEYATAPMYLTAAASTSFLGLSSLAFGALVLYTTIGMAYLVSAAKEAYQTNAGIGAMLESRISKNSWSVTGVICTVGAVLWSPFLLIGGVAGKMAKATVNLFSSDKSSSGHNHGDHHSDSDDNDNELDDVSDLGMRAAAAAVTPLLESRTTRSAGIGLPPRTAAAGGVMSEGGAAYTRTPRPAHTAEPKSHASLKASSARLFSHAEAFAKAAASAKAAAAEDAAASSAP